MRSGPSSLVHLCRKSWYNAVEALETYEAGDTVPWEQVKAELAEGEGTYRIRVGDYRVIYIVPAAVQRELA